MKNTLTNRKGFLIKTLEASLDIDGLRDEVKSIVDHAFITGKKCAAFPFANRHKDRYEVNEANKWQMVRRVFYSYRRIDDIMDTEKFTDTLQGLPSYLTVPFYNHDILAKAREYGLDIADDDDTETEFIERYWRELGNTLNMLSNVSPQIYAGVTHG